MTNLKEEAEADPLVIFVISSLQRILKCCTFLDAWQFYIRPLPSFCAVISLEQSFFLSFFFHSFFLPFPFLSYFLSLFIYLFIYFYLFISKLKYMTTKNAITCVLSTPGWATSKPILFQKALGIV